MTLSDSRLVEIYRAKNLPQAQVIRIVLEQAGIHALIDGELLQGVVGELPMGWVTAPRIKVAESDVHEALKIISDVEDAEAVTEGNEDGGQESRCLSCGQLMSDVRNRVSRVWVVLSCRRRNGTVVKQRRRNAFMATN